LLVDAEAAYGLLEIEAFFDASIVNVSYTWLTVVFPQEPRRLQSGDFIWRLLFIPDQAGF
jgi:hypothetical protein